MARSVISTVAEEGRDAAVKQAVEELAKEMGENPNVIGTYGVEWQKFVNQGVSIELNISGWTAETQTQPEDLGLTPQNEEEREAWRKMLRLPSRYLLPENEISKVTKIRVAGRHALYGAARKVLGAWFVHAKRYDTLKTELTDLQQRYLAAWQYVVDHWDELVAEAEREYRRIGHGNFQRLRQAGVTEAFGMSLYTTNEEAYVEAFVKHVMRRLPTKRYVESSFSFDWQVRYLPLAEMLTEQKAAELQAEFNQAKTEMERDVLRQRMDREAHQRELQQFARDLQGALYERVYNTTLEGIEILQGKVGKTLKSGDKRIPIDRLRTMCEFVNESLFWPDDRLAARVRELGALLPESNRESTEADRRSVEVALARMATESRLLLQSIDWPADRVRPASHVGIPEDVVELRETTRRRPQRTVEVPAEEIEGMPTPRRRRRVE